MTEREIFGSKGLPSSRFESRPKFKRRFRDLSGLTLSERLKATEKLLKQKGIPPARLVEFRIQVIWVRWNIGLITKDERINEMERIISILKVKNPTLYKYFTEDVEVPGETRPIARLALIRNRVVRQVDR